MTYEELIKVPLKRCPFCGAEATLHWYKTQCTKYKSWVECRLCGSQTCVDEVEFGSQYGIAEEEAKCKAISIAIGSWNVRCNNENGSD